MARDPKDPKAASNARSSRDPRSASNQRSRRVGGSSQDPATRRSPQTIRRQQRTQVQKMSNKGKSERQIAKDLGISRASVRHHKKQIAAGKSVTDKPRQTSESDKRQKDAWKRRAERMNRRAKRNRKTKKEAGGKRAYVGSRWSTREGKMQYSIYKK